MCQQGEAFLGSSETNCGAEVKGIYLSDIFIFVIFQTKELNPMPRSSIVLSFTIALFLLGLKLGKLSYKYSVFSVSSIKIKTRRASIAFYSL